MEENRILQLCRKRRSVRTFEDRPLSKEQTDEIRQFIEAMEEPFHAGVFFRFLNREEYGLSAPVLKGEPAYITICAKKGPYGDVAAGYAGEKLILHLCGMGLGTVWIGGTMDREAFTKASALSEDEMMVCITPVGVPAAKMSLRENLMRKGVKSDRRFAMPAIFQEEDSLHPALQDALYIAALEAVRLAPSAVNKQPWRIVHDSEGFHFYLERSLKKTEECDMQRVDLGIALYHFCAVLEEKKKDFRIVIEPKEREGLEYIASVIAE